METVVRPPRLGGNKKSGVLATRSTFRPNPALAPLSMAFAINSQDNTFELFMRNWIDMKIQNQDIDELFNYWIAGKKPTSFSRVQRNK